MTQAAEEDRNFLKTQCVSRLEDIHLEAASREAAAVAELEHSREEATALEAELAAERTWTLLELDRQHEAHTALAEALAEAQVALHRSEEEQEARQVRLARTCI